MDANRENGFDEGIKNLLTELYPDNAHFIYELLQNAEDAGASEVLFTLTKDSVDFEHNGACLFSLKDVNSITSIGASTKRDDPTNIGKFGVGFKAVFAYTNTPEIHSGEFNFRIHDLVVPETGDVKKAQMGKWETRFIFPFNHPKKQPEQAVEDIERALRALGDNTLLFLNHIRKIEYLLPDASLGTLERKEHESGQIEIHASHPGGSDAVSHWLRFQKDVEVTDDGGKAKLCRIAIAYSLVKEEDKKKAQLNWKIDSLKPGQVSIFFPAEKETSNLRFHLHAPFASTVARDSVRDCKANKTLRNYLAQLAASSLTSIRDQGWLTVGFLATLPNPGDNLPKFYEPIREAIVAAFKNESLVPVRKGSHDVAANLIRSPAKIASVLSDDDITRVAGKQVWVAANPPQMNQREDQFLKSLSITEWEWKELNIALSSDSSRTIIDEWLAEMNNESLVNLYELLKHSKEQDKYFDRTYKEYRTNLNVERLRIVRARASAGMTMCRPKDAFFPVDAVTSRPTDINVVEPDFCSGDSKTFLEDIGVKPYDEKAAIQKILAEYSAARDPGTEHYNNVKRFISFWKKNPGEFDLFKNYAFLLRESRDGKLFWCRPPQLYLDSPYRETLLHLYYKGLPDDKRTHYALASMYKEHGIDPKELSDFAEAVGVHVHLVAQPKEISSNHPEYEHLQSGNTCKRSYNDSDRENKDFDIKEFEYLLQKKELYCSKLVWKTMCESVEPEHLLATYKHNNYSELRRAKSQLIHRLIAADWVPQDEGRFVKPPAAKSSELPAGFRYDPGSEWLKAVGFGTEEIRRTEEYQSQDQIAKAMGLGSAEELTKIVDVYKKSGLTLEQFGAIGKQEKPSQPENAVKNPEKRRTGVQERTETAPPKESVTRERSIQPDVPEVTAEAKAYLRVNYKNPDGQLICQCCQYEMPFKLKSGDHYFEAVQCVRDQKAHYYQNRLALCPTCAAMYQHARDTDDDEIRRRIVTHNAPDTAPFVKIPVNLADQEYRLHFVGTHWFDLKIVFSGNADV